MEACGSSCVTKMCLGLIFWGIPDFAEPGIWDGIHSPIGFPEAWTFSHATFPRLQHCGPNIRSVLRPSRSRAKGTLCWIGNTLPNDRRYLASKPPIKYPRMHSA